MTKRSKTSGSNVSIRTRVAHLEKEASRVALHSPMMLIEYDPGDDLEQLKRERARPGVRMYVFLPKKAKPDDDEETGTGSENVDDDPVEN